MAGCRDCDICTRDGLTGCLFKYGRALIAVCTLFISEIVIAVSHIGKKKCPTCGHLLSHHQRDEQGRFID